MGVLAIIPTSDDIIFLDLWNSMSSYINQDQLNSIGHNPVVSTLIYLSLAFWYGLFTNFSA